MTERNLFDYLKTPDPRSTDPETSFLASIRDPNRRSNDRRRALAAHYNNPDGLTDFELAAIMHRQQTSAGKRRGELRDYALIEDSEIRRPAPSGSLAIVWRITEAGKKLWDDILHKLPPYAHGKTRSESAA